MSGNPPVAQHEGGSLVGGRYRLARAVATGGQGEIWQAHDERLDRGVAVKLLRPGPVRDPRARERFRREARTMATLEHPNVVRVVDTVEDDRGPAIVMEWVDGESLAARLRRAGPLDVSDALQVADGVLTALDAAHRRGVVHRDVKPSNVILGSGGAVKLTDFGVAASDGDTTLTEPGTIVGSAPYLAPEQLRGEPATERTDLYAASLVLYEALTGTRPFEAETPPATAMARLNGPPAPIRRLRTDLPAPVAAVVMRGLALKPEHRFASAQVMRDALHEAARAPAAAGDDSTQPVAVGWRAAGAIPGGVDGPTSTMVDPAGDDATAVDPTDPDPSRDPADGRPAGVVSVEPVPRRRAGRPPSGGPAPAWMATATRLVVGAVALFVAVAVVLALAGGEGSTSDAEPSACCDVPRLGGQTVDEATAALAASGLTVGTVFERPSGFPEGTVLEQLPPPGETLTRGDPVDLVVAVPPPPPEPADGDGDGDGDEPGDGEGDEGGRGNEGRGNRGRGNGGDD